MKKGISTLLTVALTTVVILAIATGIYYFYLAPKSDKEITTDSSSDSDNSITEKSAYLLYSETISETNNAERSWPTVNIYRTIDGGSKDLLASVGKVGEYPNSFYITPDKTKLLINLESKLQILDLSSKTIADLFFPEHEVGGIVFSPNGEELLIWDQNYASNDKGYSIHRFNLSTKADTILKKGTMGEKPQYLTPYSWRSDDKIALMEPMGEAVDYWYFDLNDAKIKESAVSTGSVYIAGNQGTLIATASGSVGDICNEMSASTPNAYDVADNVSGVKAGTISSGSNYMSVVAFSPTDTEIMYYTTPPTTDKATCDQASAKTYYTANVASGKSTPLADYRAKLKEWGIDNIGASYSNSADGKISNIVLGDQVLATSAKSMQIIAQYWK